MSRELTEAWSRLMSGREVDVVAFTDLVLERADRAGEVRASTSGPTAIQLVDGDETSEISGEAAGAKLRMVCARLATVFGAASSVPPTVYGGALTCHVRVGGVLRGGSLEFENTADGWFRLRLTDLELAKPTGCPLEVHDSVGRAIVQALESATARAVAALFSERAAESFYYVSLITTTGGGLAPFLSAWSWEALAEAARRSPDPAATQCELKWSYADSPYCLYGKDCFSTVRELFARLPTIPITEWTRDVDWRLSLMEEAVRRLDSVGTFGTGAVRRQRVILVELVPPDAANTDRALRLNPDSPLLQDWLREAGE